jgi:hypothetical protein
VTRVHTNADGWCWFFGAVDHCVGDVVGRQVAKKGGRWAALEPISQGVRAHLDGSAPKIALGLGLRDDWGPRYTATRPRPESAGSSPAWRPAFAAPLSRKPGLVHLPSELDNTG